MNELAICDEWLLRHLLVHFFLDFFARKLEAAGWMVESSSIIRKFKVMDGLWLDHDGANSNVRLYHFWMKFRFESSRASPITRFLCEWRRADFFEMKIKNNKKKNRKRKFMHLLSPYWIELWQNHYEIGRCEWVCQCVAHMILISVCQCFNRNRQNQRKFIRWNVRKNEKKRKNDRTEWMTKRKKCVLLSQVDWKFVSDRLAGRWFSVTQRDKTWFVWLCWCDQIVRHTSSFHWNSIEIQQWFGCVTSKMVSTGRHVFAKRM